MSLEKTELERWLATLPTDDVVFLDEDGLAIHSEMCPAAYLEIGGGDVETKVVLDLVVRSTGDVKFAALKAHHGKGPSSSALRNEMASHLQDMHGMTVDALTVTEQEDGLHVHVEVASIDRFGSLRDDHSALNESATSKQCVQYEIESWLEDLNLAVEFIEPAAPEQSEEIGDR